MKKLIFIIVLFSAGFVFTALAEAKTQPTKLQVAGDKESRAATPRIDEKAACVVRECEDAQDLINDRIAGQNKYPQNFWTFLFGIYLFLLIFNLSSDLKKKKELQWFWTAVYTFLAVFTWDKLDPGRLEPWFPAVIMESGIVVYAFYLYYFWKKSKSIFEAKKPSSPKQGKLL